MAAIESFSSDKSESSDSSDSKSESPRTAPVPLSALHGAGKPGGYMGELKVQPLFGQDGSTERAAPKISLPALESMRATVSEKPESSAPTPPSAEAVPSLVPTPPEMAAHALDETTTHESEEKDDDSDDDEDTDTVVPASKTVNPVAPRFPGAEPTVMFERTIEESEPVYAPGPIHDLPIAPAETPVVPSALEIAPEDALVPATEVHTELAMPTEPMPEGPTMSLPAEAGLPIGPEAPADEPGEGPPMPPVLPPTEHGTFEPGEPEEPNSWYSTRPDPRFYSYRPSADYSGGHPMTPMEQPPLVVERRSRVSSLLLAGLTGFAIRGYFARRKARETARTIADQNERIEDLTTEQQRMQQTITRQSENLNALAHNQSTTERPTTTSPERPADTLQPQPPAERLSQPEAARQPALTPEQAAAEQKLAEAFESQLAPGGHIRIERSAWHAIALENGVEKEGAIDYGKAFQDELTKERTPLAQTQDDAGLSGGGAYVTNQQQAQYQEMLRQQQARADQLRGASIENSTPSRSAKSDNPVVTTLKQPLLWVAVVVLLAAFFAAALL